GCTEAAEYSWDTGTSGEKLDLLGVKAASDYWISSAYNSNGLPTVVATGDIDDDPSPSDPDATRRTWLFYGNSSFPGRVTESRHQSDGSISTCDDTTTTGCARTLYTYNSDG